MIVEGGFQSRFLLNVRCRILRNKLIEPLFIDGKLNALKYQRALNQLRQDYLEDLPLARLLIRFFSNGKPLQNATVNISYLHAQLVEK